MRAVVQRVSECALKINGEFFSQIGEGLLVLLGVEQDDTLDDAAYLVGKIAQMRIFSDEEGKMNRSVKDINGEVMLVSQFTLHADTKKGNRPSFIKAARPEHAIPLYESTIVLLKAALEKEIKTGVFGADMKISLVNDGPVTIIMDSKSK